MEPNQPRWKSHESPVTATREDRRRLNPVLTTEQAAQWICDTSLRFGASVSTAHKVAGAFAEALEQLGGPTP